MTPALPAIRRSTIPALAKRHDGRPSVATVLELSLGDYDGWFIEHIFILVPAQAIVGQFLATFQEFPPRQKPGSFSVDQALEKMMNQKSSN